MPKESKKPAVKNENNKPPGSVILFTVIVTLLSAAVFVMLLLILTNENLAAEKQTAPSFRGTFVLTICTMFVAGMLGGCLYNFRGITIHASLNDYERSYDLTYFLKPLSSGISGLLVFFLLLGGALTLNISTSNADTPQAWQTFAGRMPYIAFSLLAGYGAHEFMLKLKDLAESIFAVSTKDEKKS